ncbi:MAG: translation elongation factor Ts [Candidatus Saccharimonadales bacterium]
MAVDISQVKRLKDLTGVGLSDAKAALEASGGDFDAALKEMRTKGLTKAEKRSERSATAGIIGSYNHDNRIGVIVEVNCETDFVARNELFTNMVKDLAMHIAATNPQYLSRDQVPAAEFKQIEAELKERAKNDAKSKDMIPKIVAGQLDKYFAEHCLLSQPFVKNPDITVDDFVKEHNARLGENIVVRRYCRLALGEAN